MITAGLTATIVERGDETTPITNGYLAISYQHRAGSIVDATPRITRHGIGHDVDGVFHFSHHGQVRALLVAIRAV